MNAQAASEAQTVDGIPSQKLLEALAGLYQFVLVLDAEGNIVWLSNEMNTLCSRARNVVGRGAAELFRESPDFPRQFAIRSHLRQHGSLSNMRTQILDADGQRITVELSVLPIRLDEAEKPFHVAIARPVEDTRQTREHSSLDTDELAEILDCAPEAVAAVDERGFIRYANPALEELVGRPATGLLNQPVAQLLTDTDQIEQLVASLVPGDGIRKQELLVHRDDGSDVHVSASASALGGTTGKLQGTVLFLRDITERREIENALEKKNIELEHCVHSLAHDLRSPLVALLGFSRLLRQDYADDMDETRLHFIDRIEQAGRTMEELIHELLEFSRIGQGGDRCALVDPRAVLLQIGAEMKPRLEATEAHLELPEHPPLIYCDRTRLYQVFSNLIGNAIDHMGPCETPSICVEIWDEETSHEIAVRDGGRGVPVEDRELIFEVFQSLGPRADGTRSSGIGLAIVKKIAETHGGRVWIESEETLGANFRLSFPRH